MWDPANALTSNAPADLAFLNPTRYNIAKQGLAAAVAENASSTFRWGLIKLRQNTPAWRTGRTATSRSSCRTRRIALPGHATRATQGGAGNYAIYAPKRRGGQLRAGDGAGRHRRGHARGQHAAHIVTTLLRARAERSRRR